MIDGPTSLYRFYNPAGVLLYVGITNHIPRRFQQHRESKDWWLEVGRIDIEHLPDRSAALEGERFAIETERPLFNIRMNEPAVTPVPRPSRHGTGRWTFRSRRSGYERTIDLWLNPELDGSSSIDDCWSGDGEDQLQFYVRWIQDHHPEWLTADAVPIYWAVDGEGPDGANSIFETAPFQNREYYDEDFLTDFTWPYDAATGEHLDWYQLPVRMDRFPAFSAAIGWLPSPLQPHAPLRSILESKYRSYPPRRSRGLEQ